jgi:mRNA-degrading endonuclease HigB of HigAB toxin-antitoxin module
VLDEPSDVKLYDGGASIVKGNRIFFNICGNKYRLGTHVAYDKTNVEEV